MRTEAQHQALFFKMARVWLPELTRDLLWGNPSHGRQTPGQCAKNKRQGLVAGIPDIFYAWARGGYHGLHIEMKRPKTETSRKGVLSAAQKEMIDKLRNDGYRVEVCYGADEAMDVLRDYMLENH